MCCYSPDPSRTWPGGRFQQKRPRTLAGAPSASGGWSRSARTPTPRPHTRPSRLVAVGTVAPMSSPALPLLKNSVDVPAGRRRRARGTPFQRVGIDRDRYLGAGGRTTSRRWPTPRRRFALLGRACRPSAACASMAPRHARRPSSQRARLDELVAGNDEHALDGDPARTSLRPSSVDEPPDGTPAGHGHGVSAVVCRRHPDGRRARRRGSSSSCATRNGG